MKSNDQLKKFLASETFSWIKLIVIAVALALFLRTFVFRPVIVEGISMNNTLSDGDMLVLNKFQYYFTAPKRGDIVVIDVQVENRKTLIKRVIGLPGETVTIRGGMVYIDGKGLDEEYVTSDTNPGTIGDTIVLGEDEYLVLGDNRTSSLDGRYFGKITRDKILGTTSLRFWPFNHFGIVK